MAYSLRKLHSGATKAIRVRRFNQVAGVDENDEMDIGFTVDGWLDAQAMWDFCCLLGTASAGGAVTKIYDQSGNGRDFIQQVLANQPLIIENAITKLFGSRPSIYYAVNQFMRLDTAANPAVNFPGGSIYTAIFAVTNSPVTASLN